MAKKKSKVKKAFKGFFSSIGDDIKTALKSHVWRIIGFCISFILPIVYLLVTYVKKVDSNTKFIIPFVVILPITLLVIVYWVKFKKYIAIKVNQMKIENNIEKGKHAGLIILCETLKAIFTVVPFLLFYIIINELEKYTAKLSDIFLFLIVCEAVGGLFAIFDTIHNVIDYTEEIEEINDSDI